jgi:hypothetical protein
MDRRELLKLIAVATGGVMIGGEFLLTGCKNPESGPSMVFSAEDLAFLDEVAETILPQTSTAGAKAAGVGAFMTVMVNDAYTKEDQDIFHKGLVTLNEACEKMHGHGFMKATPEQRKELLISVDKEVSEYRKKQAEQKRLQEEINKQGQEKATSDVKEQTKESPNPTNKEAKEEKKKETVDLLPNHYFQQIKQLAIFGYFTSQKGRTEALRFVPVPGRWEAVIDYKKGDKAFAGLT